MGRFGSIGAALRSGGMAGASNKERERVKPAPESPREKGERLKAAKERRAKVLAKRRKPEKGTLPPPPPKNRAERRRRAQEGGAAAS